MRGRYDPMGWEYPSWSHINGPAVNLLKGGILTADRVMTVSKARSWQPAGVLFMTLLCS